MIVETVSLVIGIINFALLLNLFMLDVIKTSRKEVKKTVKKPRKISRKARKQPEMSKEDKLFYNLEIFDGTENGQMEI